VENQLAEVRRISHGFPKKIKRRGEKTERMSGRAFRQHGLRETTNQRAQEEVVHEQDEEQGQTEEPNQPTGLLLSALLPVKKVHVLDGF
jgi:hypothetical protein